MMNTLARSVLTLYSYDSKADDITLPNVLRQCLQLVALFPCCPFTATRRIPIITIKKAFYIHARSRSFPRRKNILRILRPDSSYTPP